MATANFTALYKYIDYPTFAFQLQIPPYPTTLENIGFQFTGPQTGSPIIFRILPAATGSFSATLYVGTDSNNMYNNELAASGSYTSGTWKEFTLSAGQLSVLANNNLSFIHLGVYESVPFYTSGANAPHLVVPDPGSIRVNASGWKLGIPYVNVSGVGWRQGTSYINIGGGVWKQGT